VSTVFYNAPSWTPPTPTKIVMDIKSDNFFFVLRLHFHIEATKHKFIAMTSVRKICVSYNSLSNPPRKKCVALPAIPEKEMPDMLYLKKQLHREMILDNSIQDLGGNSLTPMSDLILFQHDPDFDELEEMDSQVILPHKERNVVVKLKKHQSEFKVFKYAIIVCFIC
jgi:hypothetical protein